MSEMPQHLKDRHMILAEDGFLRFAPPAGSAFSEDQLAKIVHCMASINAELILKRLTENHPNQIDHDRDLKHRRNHHHQAVPLLDASAAAEAS